MGAFILAFWFRSRWLHLNAFLACPHLDCFGSLCRVGSGHTNWMPLRGSSVGSCTSRSHPLHFQSHWALVLGTRTQIWNACALNGNGNVRPSLPALLCKSPSIGPHFWLIQNVHSVDRVWSSVKGEECQQRPLECNLCLPKPRYHNQSGKISPGMFS